MAKAKVMFEILYNMGPEYLQIIHIQTRLKPQFSWKFFQSVFAKTMISMEPPCRQEYETVKTFQPLNKKLVLMFIQPSIL